MDKLIYSGRSIVVSNDGATVIKQLDIVHPAAKTMAEIASSQDAEVRMLKPSILVQFCHYVPADDIYTRQFWSSVVER